MSDQKRQFDDESQMAMRVRIRKIDQIFDTIRTLIKYGVLLGCVYIVRGMVHDLAGRYTFADIGIKFLGDFKISETFSYIFGGGGILYGQRQRKLRKDKVQELSLKKEQLEKIIDTQRSSSRLTSRGNTSPEDVP